MQARSWVLAGVVLAAIATGWWYSPLSPRVTPPPKIQAATQAPASSDAPPAAVVQTTPTAPGNPLCPRPPRVTLGAHPLQSPVPVDFPVLAVEDAKVTPLAGFSVDARVLSRRDYAYGREADYSPIDLALGWGRMRDAAVIERLQIEQRGRWYHYNWRDRSPPIPSREIAKSSANMHLIPSDRFVALALSRVRKDQRVRIDGWLVELKAKDGWTWRSSLTRDDQGAGGCEVIYVCDLVVLPGES